MIVYEKAFISRKDFCCAVFPNWIFSLFGLNFLWLLLYKLSPEIHIWPCQLRKPQPCYYRRTSEAFQVGLQSTVLKRALHKVSHRDFFGFLMHIKVMFLLYYSLLSVQWHYVWKNNVHTSIKKILYCQKMLTIWAFRVSIFWLVEGPIKNNHLGRAIKHNRTCMPVLHGRLLSAKSLKRITPWEE